MSAETHTVDTGEKLVRMVNQIARNLTHDKDPVAAIAQHIHAFWTVRMQQQLLDRGPEGLDPVAIAALERLAPAVSAAHGG